jgi:hypothetical protein
MAGGAIGGRIMIGEICVKFLPHESDYVYCPEKYIDYISKDHYYRFDETTTYYQLCKMIATDSNFDGNSFSMTRNSKGGFDCEYFIDEGHNIEDELHIYQSDKVYEASRKNVELTKILDAIGSNNEIILVWCVQWGGGRGVGEIEGVKFNIKPNEGTHMYLPHVHAKYGGEEIRIGLDPVTILDGRPFRSPAKTRKAISYIEENKEELMIEWCLTANVGLVKLDLPTGI